MISVALRRTVRTLYAFAGGYYGVTETEVGALLTIDHHFPQDAGGSDDLANLVYACHACNAFKSAAWNPVSPPVLHPLQTDMTLHVRILPDDTLVGVTQQGVRHIETLHLNRHPLVERRKLRRLIESLLEHELQRLKHEKHLDKETQNNGARFCGSDDDRFSFTCEIFDDKRMRPGIQWTPGRIHHEIRTVLSIA